MAADVKFIAYSATLTRDSCLKCLLLSAQNGKLCRWIFNLEEKFREAVAPAGQLQTIVSSVTGMID